MSGVSEIINRTLQNIQMMRSVFGMQALSQIGLAGVIAGGIEPVVFQALTPDIVVNFTVFKNAFGYYKPELSEGGIVIKSISLPF